MNIFLKSAHIKYRRAIMQKFRPGETVPKTCEYHAYDEYGHNGGTVFLNEGERFPATQHSGSYYVMDVSDEN